MFKVLTYCVLFGFEHSIITCPTILIFYFHCCILLVTFKLPIKFSILTCTMTSLSSNKTSHRSPNFKVLAHSRVLSDQCENSAVRNSRRQWSECFYFWNKTKKCREWLPEGFGSSSWMWWWWRYYCFVGKMTLTLREIWTIFIEDDSFVP